MLNPLLQLESKEVVALMTELPEMLGNYCDTERNLSLLKELNAKYASLELCFESGIMSGYQARIAEEKLDEIKKKVSLVHIQ